MTHYLTYHSSAPFFPFSTISPKRGYFASWWSYIGKGLGLQPAQHPSFLGDFCFTSSLQRQLLSPVPGNCYHPITHTKHCQVVKVVSLYVILGNVTFLCKNIAGAQKGSSSSTNIIHQGRY